MRMLKTIQAGALLALCAMSAAAHDQKVPPFQADPGTNDPGVFSTARGLWLRSAAAEDERQVLIGHVIGGQSNKGITVHMTLVPDRGDLTPALREGDLVGEMRLADAGLLSDQLGAIFNTDPGVEQAIGLRGRYREHGDGSGSFDAVIYVVRAGLSAKVPVGILRGSYADDMSPAATSGLSSAKGLLSQANPFSLSAAGEPVTVTCPADLYNRSLFQPAIPFSASVPFSTPEVTIEQGGFVAKWLQTAN